MERSAKMFLYPVVPFSNDCHDVEDGRFCSEGMGALGRNVDLSNLELHEKERIPGLQRVLRSIDKVIRLPIGLPRAKVEVWSDMRGAHGSYDPSVGVHLIKLGEDSPYNASTLAHEFGHHLTLSERGEGKLEFLNRVRKHPEMSAWLDAVKATPQWKAINEAEGRGSAHASYLKDSRELFARSFAQWIGERAGDGVLKYQHEKIREATSGIYQWSEEEFKPIGAALDRYFKKEGMLK